MKILAITNMMPTPRTPRAGTFIEQQIAGLKKIGLNVETVLIDRAADGPLQYASTLRVVKDAVARSRPDLVHIMYGGVLAAMATIAARRVPTVVSFCGVDLLGADYGPAWFRARTRLGVAASRAAAVRATAIVVKSRNLERGLPGDLAQTPVAIVPNGINLSRFLPMKRSTCQKSLGWDPRVFHVLFSTANRNDPKKRLPLAEEAVAFLNARGTRAEIHGLDNIAHDKVPTWLNAADVVLMTSMADEGSPNIIKEALACNRPVVSLDVGDVAERIEGIAGCYLATDAPQDIAGKLELVARGPRVVDARSHMGALTIEAVARRLLEIYALAIDRHRQTRAPT